MHIPDLFLICCSHLNSPSWVLHSALLFVKFQPLHYGPPLQLAKTILDPSPVPSKAAANPSKARTPASFTSWLLSPAPRSLIKLLSAHGKGGIPARWCQEGPRLWPYHNKNSRPNTFFLLFFPSSHITGNLIQASISNLKSAFLWNTAGTSETQHRVQTDISFKEEMRKMSWLQQCFCKWKQKNSGRRGWWMQRGRRRCRACGPTVNYSGSGTPLSCLLVEFCPSQQQ